MIKRLLLFFFLTGITLTASAQSKPRVRFKLTTQLDADTVVREKPKSGFAKVMRFLKDAREVIDDPSKLQLSVERPRRRPEKEKE
ncbi:hypothetical protein [Siphonobacter aquaeclarae]|jgi:hypothetical protein|uniref:Uncharacterized protein n=1 Tax=Siphonobacter aquaeclarae TaxID=563176 RepID=A0A1G9LCA4_9BACT|nr:hypothetical protein [Siphonobacter aquaeclarae]MBO9637584.1 hypothetical protein [Siphonobacter aquaeclarae]SDL59591.1 hypothetical protein SAMN04488090_1359 [Siphonobacter aquaeclarae]